MGEHSGGGRSDALDYMQAMLGQLRTMALAERCDLLAYMIEMAYLEASDIIRGDQPYRLQGSGMGLGVPGKKRDRAS
ncbi:MAG: hypothetical protein CMH69_17600 [Nitratireductor sp.]|uniref:hypothetical protein n=1 Tax=Nitratireductor sp. B36 TaxID=2762059 RepID=UPI000C8A081E|nr:hypothetical protein [Nitratireductor sp. B36]MAS15113.1 hypothetical protein [Nitratireductor sp.]MCC5777617.1 hypothetical protein [Nitratireductor sp. B36]